jgi:hypothetical protein
VTVRGRRAAGAVCGPFCHLALGIGERLARRNRSGGRSAGHIAHEQHMAGLLHDRSGEGDDGDDASTPATCRSVEGPSMMQASARRSLRRWGAPGADGRDGKIEFGDGDGLDDRIEGDRPTGGERLLPRVSEGPGQDDQSAAGIPRPDCRPSARRTRRPTPAATAPVVADARNVRRSSPPGGSAARSRAIYACGARFRWGCGEVSSATQELTLDGGFGRT